MDYKKEYKDLYIPKATPSVITVPPISFIMINGTGNPNEEDGSYSEAVGLLYALSYTIKMSKMGGSILKGYFEYTVPPLEGLWWMADGMAGIGYTRKQDFCWVAMIRQPEFVTLEVFFWACGEVQRKKKIDTSRARLAVLDEGLCVQCMHIGSFDDEPETVEKIERFIAENGYINDISDKRRHHEIYLSDPRKGDSLKMKTVLRIPVKDMN
ncbi:MAG: transcriptional regulator [Clostridiales bacterium GWF2_38_85]|nr:MAG: transcriptional regulator [Clostridiales bacterium GWF2_38_85]